MKPHPTVVLDPDKFRRDHCYTIEVVNVLTPHEPSLRNIFKGVAGGSGRSGKGSDMVALDEWCNFVQALGFIGIDLTARDAAFAFAWSRMAVINGRSDRGYIKESSLPFEGFMEAICRIAALKALPTDAEIAEAKQPNAGAFMAALKADEEDAYLAMLAERATPWGSEPTLQPMARCIEHTIAMIIYQMEWDVAGTENMKLSEQEAVAWFKAKGIYAYH